MVRAKSETSMECCHERTAHFWGFAISTTAKHLGRYSLPLLILKSSMARNINQFRTTNSSWRQSQRIHIIKFDSRGFSG